jgi:hypothetical protein
VGPEDSETASTAPRTAEQWENAVATRYVDDTVLATVGNRALNVKQVRGAYCSDEMQICLSQHGGWLAA